MNYTNILKLSLGGFILLAIGVGLGYWEAPDKVKIETKEVEKQKTSTEENKKVTEKYDPITGKLIEKIEQTGTKETNTNSNEKDKTVEKSKTQKHYALKVGASKSLNSTDSVVPRIGGELALPFFNTWVGAEIDVSTSKPNAGLYGRMEF